MKRVYEELHGVAEKVGHVIEETERVVRPVRVSLFERFPISATLLVTFGVTATLYGAERIMSEIMWLNERPWLLFLLGVSALACTKKRPLHGVFLTVGETASVFLRKREDGIVAPKVHLREI